MYNRNIFKTLLLIIILFASSCDSWLSLEPQDGIVREEFWKTKEQVQSSVLGCYASLLGNPTDYDRTLTEYLFLWGELRADMLAPNSGIRADELEVVNVNITPTNPISNWRPVYRTINYCNTVIEFAPQVMKVDKTFKESQMKAYLAEAYALRALMYFHLVRTFGEVPLKLDATTNDEQDLALAKSSETEILDQIVLDLSTAEESAVLTYGNKDYDKGRITRYTVNAIQADVYLWREDYANCIIACDRIINSGQFGLVEGNSDWFNTLYVKGNSNESIFEFQFDAQKLNPFYSMFSTSVGRRFLASPRVLEEIYTIDETNAANFDRRADGASINSSNGMVWKYLGTDYNTSRTADASYAHWIAYRYADVLLLKAEALNQTGQGEAALDIVNLIRKRARALPATERSIEPSDVTALGDYILEERAREFAFEGKRWYDILRNARRNNYSRMDILINMVTRSAPVERQQTIINKYGDVLSHYLPIYFYEIQTDKNLVQNRFYAQ